MNKTEQKILDGMERHPSNKYSIISGYEGSKRFGTRELNAAKSLFKKGLIELISTHPGVTYSKSMGGINGHYSDMTFKKI